MPPATSSHLARTPCPPRPRVQVHKKMSAEAKAAEMAKMKAFKAQLDAQIEENEASLLLALGWHPPCMAGKRGGEGKGQRRQGCC